MYKYVLCLCLATPTLWAQSLGINYQAGYTVPNNPDFPPLRQAAQGITVEYQFRPRPQRWTQYYRAYWTLGASYQTTGNARVLGDAYGVLPSWNFPIWQRPRARWVLGLGWGLAYLSKHYDSFENPTNTVIGSHWNAFALARCTYQRRFAPHWLGQIYAGVAHYSNGGSASPNLGINVPLLGAGLVYQWQPLESLQSLPRYRSDSTRAAYAKRFAPFVQLSVGVTDYGNRGAKFPVYVAYAGLSRQVSPTNKIGLGLEYVWHSGLYELYRLSESTMPPSQQFQRWCVLAQHEFLVGNWSFLTAGGIYINKHLAQRSLFASKIGVHYYPRSWFKHQHHQVWTGVHVRAYFGEAEFVEGVLGYLF